MAIQTATQRTVLAQAYADNADFAALYSTTPGSSPGTELSGGSPAYARKAANWSTAASSATTSTPAAFDIPSGATVAGAGYHTLVTGGTYLDGADLTDQAYASQGTYTLTATYTQS